VYGFELAACAVVALIFAKDRVMVLLVTTGVVALRLGVVLLITRDWRTYGTEFFIATGVLVALLPTLRNWKSSSGEPREGKALGLVFVMAGLALAVGVVLLLKPRI
jgi:hypothetical protein